MSAGGTDPDINLTDQFKPQVVAPTLQSEDNAKPARKTRRLAAKKVSESLSDDTHVDDLILLDEHAETDAGEGPTDVEEFEPEPGPATAFTEGLPVDEEAAKLQRKNQVWSTCETYRFYQGLKEHGKSFEMLSKFMAKFKIKRDKVQIQKYYFNLYKAYRQSARVTEDEIKSVPRDAKELFIVINGCEWKQKTSGAKICPESFRTLLLDGVANVKVKNRRVVVKTPACKALRQFFKYDEKFANIPRQLTIRLVPNAQRDKEYVLSCEQNPFLCLRMDMNECLDSIFRILRTKWLPKTVNSDKINDGCLEYIPQFKLVTSMTASLPKLIIRPTSEAQKRLSLKGLVQYCEDRMESSMETPSEEPIVANLASPMPQTAQVSGASLINRKKSRTDDIPTSIIVDSSTITEFNFRQEILAEGLTKDNVNGLSALHLYLITGMQAEISFNYHVLNISNTPSSVWDMFVSFVKRDYLWFGTDYMVHGTTHAFRKRKKLHHKKKREMPETEANSEHKEDNTEIVQDEMLGFLEQWNSMSKTSACLHQPDQAASEPGPSTSTAGMAKNPTTDSPRNTPVASTSSTNSAPVVPKKPSAAHNGFLIARPRSLANRKRKPAEQPSTSEAQPQINGMAEPPITVLNDHPTDFSFLHADPNTSSHCLPATPKKSTSGTYKDDTTDGGHSHLFPCLEKLTDGASLQRALTDEFSNQIGLMAQQNSVDYCRQFEEFVSYFQSPSKKTSRLQ